VSDGRSLEQVLEAAESGAGEGGGPPPLRPFGLRLHYDGRWTHDGQPILNRRLRTRFDRAVVFLPEEGKYIVQIGRFRGQIEVEEAGFFVRALELETGEIVLSDGSRERLRVETLRTTARDGALVCTIKHELSPGGLPARFFQSAQADLFGAVVEAEDGGMCVILGGERLPLPDELTRPMAGGD